jgi:Glycosyl transferase family 8
MPSAARRLAWNYRRARRHLPNVVRRAVLAARDGKPTSPRAAGPQAAPESAATPSTDNGPDRAALVRALTRGSSVEHAVLTQVRALLAAEEWDTVQSLAESLRRHSETATLGHLAGGMAAFRRGYTELAWDHLRGVPREAWAPVAAAEYVRSGLAIAPDEALEEVRRLVADDPDSVRARRWFEILAPVYGFGAEELARDVFAIFDRHVREDPNGWSRAAVHRDWLRPWVAASASSPSAPRPVNGRPAFAVMDYGHPSARKASANIGDHIQTIAALGHLVRHQNVRLHGREDLVDLLRQLQARTRPELQRTDVDADLEVLTVHRDASMYEEIPEGTWVLCFGWFMHALFKMRHGFPLHRNLRPIFVSFHCNKRELLTPDAVEYLKRYGPVGCRDWTTVHLLLSLGVPAFFSGCLTTTINTVFPDLPGGPGSDAPVAYVDALADVPEDAITYRHSDGEVRRRSFVANVYEGIELLETYRRRHSGVVTSRLHCYLPTRSIGMNVDFRPKNRADVRFDGLIDISDGEFDAIRKGLVDKLGQVSTAILSGRSEDEVYALWREVTADDVARAEEYRRREIRLPPVAADIDGQVAQAIEASVRREPAEPPAPDEPVHVGVVLPRGGGVALSALVSSLLEHSSRPLDLSVLALPGTGGMKRRLAERFPQIAYRYVPIGGLAVDLRTPQGTASRPRAMARLLLADLLPDVHRLVLLPLPAIATADVAALADLDLEGQLLAAPDRPGSANSGFGVIHGAAARLSFRTQAAAALRRTAHARHAFDFDAFSTDVMVLDLARMREEGFIRQALPLVEEFGLTDVEALHYLVGPNRATIPPEWAVVPTRTPLRGPGLIHWADRVKPWQPELTPERDRWRRHAASFRRSAAARA